LRFLAAVLATPFFDALLGYLAFPLVWQLGSHGGFRPGRPEEAALHFGLLTGLLGFFVMFSAAIPVAVWMIRRGRTALHHFAAAGVVLGNLPFVAYTSAALYFLFLHLLRGTLAEHLSPIPELLAGGLRAVLLGSVMGASSGAMFWLIAGPEKT